MTGTMRLSRGLAVAALVIVISAALHTASGGCVAHLSSLEFLALTLLTAGSAVLLSAREWTLPRLVVWTGIAQVCFHAMFEGLDNGHNTLSIIGSPHAADAHASHWMMTVSHVVAVVLIALILRRGERWLLAFAAFLVSLLPPALAPRAATHAPTRLLLPQAPKESGLRRILFACLLTHRGPPRAAYAFMAA